ncbi:protein FAM246C [Leptodactylus fuscus]
MTHHSTIGFLYTISEGSQSESPSISPPSAGSNTTGNDMDREIKTPQSGSRGKQDDDSKIVKNGPFNKGKSHPRLAQLRGQIRAQIREHSPRNQMIELVDKVANGQLNNKNHLEENKRKGPLESNRMCHCSNPSCFASELEGRLHIELTELRLEMKHSLEAMKAELGQELQAIHKEVIGCCHHCPPKDAEGPKEAEKRPEWKSVFKKVNRKDIHEAKSPSKLDGQFKAKSVPSLVHQSGPSRNQVLLKAMTTIAAKNALMSSLGTRSDSDPIPHTASKHIHKPIVKIEEPPAHSQTNGNWGKKINRTVAPLPQNGISVGKGH